MHMQNTNQHLTKRFMVVQWQRSFTSTSQVGQSPAENQRKKCLGVAPLLAIPIPFDRGNKRQLIPGYCPSMGVAREQLCMYVDRQTEHTGVAGEGAGVGTTSRSWLLTPPFTRQTVFTSLHDHTDQINADT